ncbi:MAG: 5-formyltetrahydrofolate cyclo-ligase [Cytophagales bacterium]|nr:5-formyltetrahydrofolate cyclo-ligase [Cytophagales bacterium]
MSSFSNKVFLRKKLLSERKAYSPQRRVRESLAMFRRFVQYGFWHSGDRVHLFSSISTLGEPDTYPLFILFWSLGCPTFSSYLDEKQNMISIRCLARTSFHIGNMGIPVPKHYLAVQDSVEFDLILVPLLGFNAQGHRIGYGKGYYDKFLSQHSESLRIGLCLHPHIIPFRAHHDDIPLHLVITPQKTHHFI